MIEKCTVIEYLAKGGQKTVQLATHPDLGKVVIKRGSYNYATSLHRIKREVELLTELDSEYYPKQHYFHVSEDKKEFEIVENYIEGSILRKVFVDFAQPKAIFTLLDSLVRGLSIIWDKNIVHRDLKPENIIIRPNGSPCIIDLGIARFLDEESLTRTLASAPFTPIYAAPEQLNYNKEAIDTRTDFFALGIIALELFLGKHPFGNIEDGAEIIMENIIKNSYILHTDRVEPNESITNFASRTLAKHPHERFRNYKKLQDFIKNQLPL